MTGTTLDKLSWCLVYTLSTYMGSMGCTPHRRCAQHSHTLSLPAYSRLLVSSDATLLLSEVQTLLLSEQCLLMYSARCGCIRDDHHLDDVDHLDDAQA